MCLVGHVFGGEIFLINNIGPISCILANWIECCSQRLFTHPRIIPKYPAILYQDIWWKGWSAWAFRYLWWHIGPFCHDTFVSDEEVENHIDNRHHPNDSPRSFCPNIFKEKAEVIELMKVQRYKQIGIPNVLFLSRRVLRILWNISSITTSADADTLCAVFYALLYTYFRVIPYKSTEKNVTTFFFGFLTKKVKSFDILVVKTFFLKLNFGYFWPL